MIFILFDDRMGSCTQDGIVNLMVPAACQAVQHDRSRRKLGSLAPRGEGVAPKLAMGIGRDRVAAGGEGVEHGANGYPTALRAMAEHLAMARGPA
jgi:hypothetical protein